MGLSTYTGWGRSSRKDVISDNNWSSGDFRTRLKLLPPPIENVASKPEWTEECEVKSLAIKNSALPDQAEASCLAPTQEEIDAEAWQIFQNIVKKHSATWTELAKY